MNDEKLLETPSNGDAIAQELKCNFASLTNLYNNQRTYLKANKRLEQEHAIEEDANHISSGDTNLVRGLQASFRLADIVHVHAQRLEHLGVGALSLNSTRLKKILLSIRSY